MRSPDIGSLSLREYPAANTGETAIAGAATVQQQIDHLIHSIRRHQSAAMTAIARLSTGHTPGFSISSCPGSAVRSSRSLLLRASDARCQIPLSPVPPAAVSTGTVSGVYGSTPPNIYTAWFFHKRQA
jgi:hypothetical protein